MRDVFPNRRKVALGFFRFTFEQLPRFLVNLVVPFGKLFDQFRRDALDFKITTRFIFDLVAQFDQRARQFVVIDIFHELLRPKHFVILQCLPFFLDRVKCGVEQNAMAVQVRVQCPRGFVLEYCRHDVAGEPVSAFSFFANPCRRE